jgi:hypothetical protein
VFASAALGGVIARRERLDPIGFAALVLLVVFERNGGSQPAADAASVT